MRKDKQHPLVSQVCYSFLVYPPDGSGIAWEDLRSS